VLATVLLGLEDALALGVQAEYGEVVEFLKFGALADVQLRLVDDLGLAVVEEDVGFVVFSIVYLD
jgi:hypothetical protein